MLWANAATAAVIVTTGTQTGNRDNFTGTVGTQFTIGGSDVTINALGYEDPGDDGLVLAHQVGLWNSSGTLLDSVTVSIGSGDTFDSGWRYVQLGSSITLTAGQTYTLGAQVNSGSGDGWTDAFGGTAVFGNGPGIVDAILTQVHNGGGGFTMPTADGGQSYFRWAPANATFIIPEPNSVVLLSCCAIGLFWRRRRKSH